MDLVHPGKTANTVGGLCHLPERPCLIPAVLHQKTIGNTGPCIAGNIMHSQRFRIKPDRRIIQVQFHQSFRKTNEKQEIRPGKLCGSLKLCKTCLDVFPGKQSNAILPMILRIRRIHPDGSSKFFFGLIPQTRHPIGFAQLIMGFRILIAGDNRFSQGNLFSQDCQGISPTTEMMENFCFAAEKIRFIRISGREEGVKNKGFIVFAEVAKHVADFELVSYGIGDLGSFFKPDFGFFIFMDCSE